MADSQNSFQTPGFNSGDVAMDKNAGAKGDDGNVSVEKMEDIIFTWLCEADDLGTYTQRIVRDKMEKHLNLPAKSLKRDEALKQATENAVAKYGQLNDKKEKAKDNEKEKDKNDKEKDKEKKRSKSKESREKDKDKDKEKDKDREKRSRHSRNRSSRSHRHRSHRHRDRRGDRDKSKDKDRDRDRDRERERHRRKRKRRELQNDNKDKNERGGRRSGSRDSEVTTGDESKDNSSSDTLSEEDECLISPRNDIGQSPQIKRRRKILSSVLEEDDKDLSDNRRKFEDIDINMDGNKNKRQEKSKEKSIEAKQNGGVNGNVNTPNGDEKNSKALLASIGADLKYLQSLTDDLRKKKTSFKRSPIKKFDDTRKDDLIKQISDEYHVKIENVCEYAKTIEIGILTELAKRKKNLRSKISELNSEKQKLHSSSDLNQKKVKISTRITTLENQIKKLETQKAKKEMELSKVNKEISQQDDFLTFETKQIDDKLANIDKEEQSWTDQMFHCNKWVPNKNKHNGDEKEKENSNKDNSQVEQSLQELRQILKLQRFELAKNWKTWNQEDTSRFLTFVVSTALGDDLESKAKISGYLNAIKRSCNLDGSDLAALNETTLKIIGIGNGDDRNKILAYINQMINSK